MGKVLETIPPRKFCDASINKLEENFTSNPENPNEEFNNFFKILNPLWTTMHH